MYVYTHKCFHCLTSLPHALQQHIQITNFRYTYWDKTTVIKFLPSILDMKEC